MSGSDAAFRRDLAATYIRENFAQADRLAVVLIDRKRGSVIQRLARADKIASPEFLDWLQRLNEDRHDVYISMNSLNEQAKGRTKRDVECIRHLYLDFDENGRAAVEALSQRKDLPPPSFMLNTSPDKWQVSWKVDGFSKEEAESVQKHLARECGGDPATTDCSRVLRVPGFFNHKYAEPYLVRLEPYNHQSDAVFRRDWTSQNFLSSIGISRGFMPTSAKYAVPRPADARNPKGIGRMPSARWREANRSTWLSRPLPFTDDTINTIRSTTPL